MLQIEKFNPYGDSRKLAQSWIVWKRNFEHFAVAKNVRRDERLLSLLLFSAGPDVQRVYEQKKLTADNEEGETLETQYEQALRLLDSVFLKKTNETFQRTVFRGLTQQSDENIMTYVARLRDQAIFCGFGDSEAQEKAMKDQVMEKGSSNQLRQAMWKKDRDFGEMLTLAQTLENAEAYEKDYKGKQTEVNYLDSSKRFKAGKATNNKGEVSRCWSCDRSGHLRSDPKCPAKGKVCLKCKRRGHFSTCCRSDKKPQFQKKRFGQSNVNFVKEEDDEADENSTEYVFNVDEGDAETVSCEVGGVEITMIIDSGTKRNLISFKSWEEMKEKGVIVKEQLKGSDITLKAYGQDEAIPVRGRFKAELDLNGIKKDQWFYVVMKGKSNLLGKSTAKEHKVLKLGGGNVNALQSEFPKIKGDDDFMFKW